MNGTRTEARTAFGVPGSSVAAALGAIAFQLASSAGVVQVQSTTWHDGAFNLWVTGPNGSR